LATAAVFLSLGLAESNEKGATGKAVYFLKDDSHKQWCAYASESRFKAQIQSLRALVVGGADYADGRLLTIRLTETDETGDWAVNDEYTVNGSGKIQTLKRTVNILPEDSSEEQLFVIEKGSAVKQRSVYHELRTGKVTQKPVNWFQAPAVITDAEAFPFLPLIGSRRNEVWSRGSLCIP
jgi:hypothetical protein